MRHRRTRDIVIELTSLLDVVMILIFAVMIENTKLVQSSQNELNVANSQIEMQQEEIQEMALSAEELQALLDKLANGDKKDLVEQIQKDEQMLQAYKYLDSIIVSVNVSLENKNGKRCLSFGTGTDEKSYKTYSVEKADIELWNDAVNQLKIFVNDTLSNDYDPNNQNMMAYLILSADYSRVYSNDFDDVQNALMSVASKDQKIVYYPNKLNED